MKKNLLILTSLFISSFAFGQVGINTNTPQRTLHVNGHLQITNELNVGGNDSTAGNAGIAGQVLVSSGANEVPTWQTLSIPTLPTLATGTVISIDGQLRIAQEITLQMTDNYTFEGATTGNGVPIGNLTNVIIDNENMYSGTDTGNSFAVNQDGVYQVFMNVQVQTTNGTTPVIGIWDENAGNWIARVSDNFTAPTNGLQTYTLITSIPMEAGKFYSFRFFNTTSVTIRHLSSGFTGSGPVTQISLKRLK